jgi:hypothetical protein
MGITHTYNFGNDTGMMWIKRKNSNTLTEIFEFTIDNSNFDCTYVRTISMTTTSTTSTVGGIGVIDSTHLLLCRISNAAFAGNGVCQLILVNITNNTIVAGDITVLATLPTVGTNNLALRGSIQVMANNKIVLGCVQANSLAFNLDTYWVQYIYNPVGPSATFEFQFTDDNNTKASIGAFPWNGDVLLWNRAASSLTNSSIGMKSVTWTGVANFSVYPPFQWVGNIQNMIGNDGGQRYALSFSTAYPTVDAINTCNFGNL